MSQNPNHLNPYAAPSAAASWSSDDSPWSADRVDFTAIIRRWEKLRVFYNATLVSVVLLLVVIVFPARLADAVFWAEVVAGAVLANLAYLAGPTLEGYGRYFGIWTNFMTTLLFVVGTWFATMLAIGSIVLR
jgi:hypothetical protein